MTVLRGPRLDLRPLAEGDEALYVQLYCDPQAMQQIGKAQDRDTAARGFRTALAMNAAKPATRLFWVIQDRAAGQALGLLGLTIDEPAGGEVGVLLPPSHQGRGLATEAIAALADHAFSTLQLRRLHTRHRHGHALAAGLMATLGFEQESLGSDDSRCRWQLTATRWNASPRRHSPANPLT